MSFPRYPSYKDSGVEWLGEVPEHWKAVPIKHLGRLKGGAGFPHENQGIDGEELSFHKVNALAQADRDGFLAKSDNTIDRATAKELGAFVFPPDSIVFAKVGAALLLGRIRMLNQDACLDNNMMGLVIRENEFHVKFVRNAMNLVRFDLIANPGAVPSLNEGQIGDFRLPMPPLQEQSQIATFLDRETAKIDELVAEQRRLMELLKEKRQAVISHAVTKGLNPDAPMKPSGIEWLGDVPAHWETRTIAKASTKITNGFVGPTRDILVDAGTPYIQATHIKNGRINFDDGYFVTPEWSNVHAKSILAEGDVLIVQTGAGTGDVGLVSESEVGFNCHALIIVAADKSLLLGTFLSGVLQSTYGQEKLTSIQTGAMHPHLNCGEVKFVEIPIPTLAEQADIVAYIRDTANQFDTLTTEAQRAIDLLQERRTALISAAVTGQIDVRGVCA